MALMSTDGRGETENSPVSQTPNSMMWVPGVSHGVGQTLPEEAPVHRVAVDGFCIDKTPVTNAQFRQVVRETGHTSFAEIPPDPRDYPGAEPEMLYVGSLVLAPPCHAVDLRDWSQWWQFMKGANWRHPYGRKSNITSTHWHTPSGPARTCLRRPSGSLPHAALRAMPRPLILPPVISDFDLSYSKSGRAAHFLAEREFGCKAISGAMTTFVQGPNCGTTAMRRVADWRH
jgi:hypothetical protein